MPEFSQTAFIRQSRQILSGLFRPDPRIYWTDFLISLTIGYVAGGFYLLAPMYSVQQVVGFLVAGFALYRVGIFMHEVVHFHSGQMRYFRLGYDLLAGIVMLSPSFFYESHISHHNTRHYGTATDGEYLPLGRESLGKLGLFLAQILLLPAFVSVRFALTPLSFLHPKLRRWTWERASSFVIDFSHRREYPEGGVPWGWLAMEWACCLRVWAIFIFIGLGINEWTRVPQLYCLAGFILGLNHIRTLVAHRYLGGGERMSHADQFFDSTNIEGVPVLTELLCPLNLRYHALHHLFPTLPYHNMRKAHSRLMQQLPADSPYRDTIYSTMWSVFGELVGNIRRGQPAEEAAPANNPQSA